MNINQTILDATGREIYTFGGIHAYETHTYKGYLVTLEWFIGRRSTEPMMCIQSASQGIDAGMLGICLSSIGKYADPSGRPADTALQACREALPMLGKANLELEVHTLLDVVLHFTPALIRMPPAPMAIRKAEAGKPLLDVELTDERTGKTINEVTL
jgi:hypothetical protein